jgi:hypothetical protein
LRPSFFDCIQQYDSRKEPEATQVAQSHIQDMEHAASKELEAMRLKNSHAQDTEESLAASEFQLKHSHTGVL